MPMTDLYEAIATVHRGNGLNAEHARSACTCCVVPAATR